MSSVIMSNMFAVGMRDRDGSQCSRCAADAKAPCRERAELSALRPIDSVLAEEREIRACSVCRHCNDPLRFSTGECDGAAALAPAGLVVWDSGDRPSATGSASGVASSPDGHDDASARIMHFMLGAIGSWQLVDCDVTLSALDTAPPANATGSHQSPNSTARHDKHTGSSNECSCLAVR